jgi:hypothetical protein
MRRRLSMAVAPKTSEEKLDALIRGVTKVLEKVDQGKSKIIRRPASTNFYSPRGGQLQFAVGSPRWGAPEDKDGLLVSYIDKEGAVFIEAAPPNPEDPGKLDWKNKKIVFALSDKDIAVIVDALETGALDKGGNLVNLTHTTGPENAPIVKYFKIKPGTPAPDGRPTFLMEVADQSAKNKVSVFVGRADITRLKLVLAGSINKVLGWDVA